MGAQVSSNPHLSLGAHGRDTLGMAELRTAGEVLRDALRDGTAKRALARKLAGFGADNTAIEAWRAVVVRAARGSEPNADQAAHIAETFGTNVRSLNGPQAERPRRGLAELEADVDALTVALEAARLAHRRLLRRVSALEKASPREAAPTKHRERRRG